MDIKKEEKKMDIKKEDKSERDRDSGDIIKEGREIKYKRDNEDRDNKKEREEEYIKKEDRSSKVKNDNIEMDTEEEEEGLEMFQNILKQNFDIHSKEDDKDILINKLKNEIKKSNPSIEDICIDNLILKEKIDHLENKRIEINNMIVELQVSIGGMIQPRRTRSQVSYEQNSTNNNNNKRRSSRNTRQTEEDYSPSKTFYKFV